MENFFGFNYNFLLLPGSVVESKRNPLIFRFLAVTSPGPDKVAESNEDDSNDDDAIADDEARTRIMRG